MLQIPYCRVASLVQGKLRTFEELLTIFSSTMPPMMSGTAAAFGNSGSRQALLIDHGHAECLRHWASMPKGIDSETPKTLRVWGMGGESLSPADSGAWGSTDLPHCVQGGASTEIKFYKIWIPKKPSGGTYFSQFATSIVQWFFEWKRTHHGHMIINTLHLTFLSI